MIEILTGIGEAIATLITFFINTISSLIWVVTNIDSFLTTVTSLAAYCPTFLLAFLEISLALTALFAVLKML